ncbi:hypothetical protein B0H16DRAFT_1691073 [Mycena metata]|uniref:Uncharacterized protein n=1 Tax=Mycena metata TaxID=1033252 RepID=A0AAD7NA77_9AGAR|nr:hypothetical protein B0H16DRAFT_1691073 [Mycena metata]
MQPCRSRHPGERGCRPHAITLPPQHAVSVLQPRGVRVDTAVVSSASASAARGVRASSGRAPSKTHVLFQSTFGSTHTIYWRQHWLHVRRGRGSSGRCLLSVRPAEGAGECGGFVVIVGAGRRSTRWLAAAAPTQSLHAASRCVAGVLKTAGCTGVRGGRDGTGVGRPLAVWGDVYAGRTGGCVRYAPSVDSAVDGVESSRRGCWRHGRETGARHFVGAAARRVHDGNEDAGDVHRPRGMSRRPRDDGILESPRMESMTRDKCVGGLNEGGVGDRRVESQQRSRVESSLGAICVCASPPPLGKRVQDGVGAKVLVCAWMGDDFGRGRGEGAFGCLGVRTELSVLDDMLFWARRDRARSGTGDIHPVLLAPLAREALLVVARSNTILKQLVLQATRECEADGCIGFRGDPGDPARSVDCVSWRHFGSPSDAGDAGESIDAETALSRTVVGDIRRAAMRGVDAKRDSGDMQRAFNGSALGKRRYGDVEFVGAGDGDDNGARRSPTSFYSRSHTNVHALGSSHRREHCFVYGDDELLSSEWTAVSKFG